MDPEAVSPLLFPLHFYSCPQAFISPGLEFLARATTIGRNLILSSLKSSFNFFASGIFPGPILTLLLQKQAHPSTANKGIWTRKPCPLYLFPARFSLIQSTVSSVEGSVLRGRSRLQNNFKGSFDSLHSLRISPADSHPITRTPRVLGTPRLPLGSRLAHACNTVQISFFNIALIAS